MTGNEALKLIYDLIKQSSEKLDAKTIFLLGEAIGTLEHIIDKKIEELEKKAECAEACGMKRAWDVARKILSRHGEGYNATDMEVFGTDDVFSLSASEAVAKLEAWEKKQGKF